MNRLRPATDNGVTWLLAGTTGYRSGWVSGVSDWLVERERVERKEVRLFQCLQTAAVSTHG
jgi:hypothetical protein